MFQALSDVELVGFIQSNPSDQRAWREVINRVEKPLRRRVYDFIGSSAKHEDVEDAVQYATIEFHRRIQIAKIEVFEGTEDKKPVSLAAFAKTSSAATGVRSVRRDQYGPDYETKIVPALELQSLIEHDKLSVEQAAERVGIDVERAEELLLELAAVPTPLDPEVMEASDIRLGRSAEEAYENSPGAMLDAIAPILPSPEVRAYVVRLAGSREHFGEGAEGRDVRAALGLDESQYNTIRRRASREVAKSLGATGFSFDELAEHRERAAAIIRGEVSA